MRLAVILIAGAALASAQTPAAPPQTPVPQTAPGQPMHLTLAEAQRLAVQNNPRPNAANFQALAAHQEPAVYNAARLPTAFGSVTGVGADAGARIAAGQLNNPSVYNRGAGGVTMSQMLTDFGRTSNLVNMSRLQAQASDQNAINVRALVVLGVSQAYYDVLRTQALLKVADETVTARQTVSDQITALFNAKQRTSLDVSFVNYNLADAKLLQAQAQSDVHAAEAQLAEELGLPQTQSFALDDEPTPPALTPAVTDLIGQAIANRPDLKDLQLQQNAAERFARAEHDLYYPSIAATGSMGLAISPESQISSRYGAVGVNVNIPILNGGLFRARQTEAELKAKAAAQNVADLSNRINRDVRVAYLNADNAFQRIALTQQLLDAATTALDLAKARSDNGLGTIVELSQAQLGLTSAQIQNTAAKYEYQTLRVALDFQLGLLR